jgi:hypothetical protein
MSAEELDGTRLTVCAICGDELQEPEGGVPEGHELFCAPCGTAHNSAIDECVARVLELSYDRHYMISFHNAGKRLLEELSKLKIELTEEEKDNNDNTNDPNNKIFSN